MKTKVMIVIEIIFGFWKTIIINFKYLPFKQAIHFPIICSSHCQLNTLHGKVKIDAPIKTGMILFGIGAYGLFDHKYDRTIIGLLSGCDLTFKGTARFGPGTKLLNNGVMTIGNNFNVTGDTRIVCSTKIEVGDNVLLSWEVLLMDKDYHAIIESGRKGSITQPISIGDHVWIGCRSTVLKGSIIPNDSIVAANSLVNKHFEENNILLGGTPARIIKRDVNWEK